jgi:acetolactate synthase-1/2/3 large subunit
LASHGVRAVFAYPGTPELALCAAIESDPRLRLINARGDTEAAFLAAGACALRAGSAAGVLHGARGLTNALGAIADNRRSETPVLDIVGQASRQSMPYLPPHAEPALITSAAFARAAFDCATVEGLTPPAS